MRLLSDHAERIDDWRLLKCARVCAKNVSRIRNSKLMRLLNQSMLGFERARQESTSHTFQNWIYFVRLRGTEGEVLKFYLDLQNEGCSLNSMRSYFELGLREYSLAKEISMASTLY
jgi:hypothetical protein